LISAVYSAVPTIGRRHLQCRTTWGTVVVSTAPRYGVLTIGPGTWVHG